MQDERESTTQINHTIENKKYCPAYRFPQPLISNDPTNHHESNQT